GASLTTLLCLFEPQVKELLEMPEDAATVAHIAVGHRTKAFPTKLDRMGLDEIVFSETWGASTYS
ncbi:MAG TPA: hypothetical protein QF846_07295, partial [Acidimicrobiales bacterium]|nr:hypothetical protein [Acidimicrobiales bacterium]